MTLIALGVLAALSVLTWWVFLGPHTHLPGADYEVPQVIACALTLAALAVVGALLLPGLAVVLVAVGFFSLAWFIDARRFDSSGLSGVGLLMLLVGAGVGLSLVVTIVDFVRRRLRAT